MFCDSPRNWWLECLPIAGLADAARRWEARLLVDTSVQPLQDLLALGAHAAICSLSKYPSLGLTLGGLFVTNDQQLHESHEEVLQAHASTLSPDAAATIWGQAVSVRDRLTQVSRKAAAVAEFLSGHPAVTAVRFPDASAAGGLSGGQVTYHATDFQTAAQIERIVGHNAGRQRSGLHLACTFGSVMTTFEHFASNERKRTGIPRDATNEPALPDDIIRIGIGCEPDGDIIADLRFAMDAAIGLTAVSQHTPPN